MKLESMYPNFLYLSLEEKIAFVAVYRKKRDLDLNTVRDIIKPAAVSKIDISEEERAVLKSLGINIGDIRALRKQETFETPEESGVLFEDSTFKEGEDE